MKTLVLMSGGLDSTVLLAVRKHMGDDIIALTMSYGQRHAREIESANKVAEFYKVQHLCMDLAQVFSFNRDISSLIMGSETKIPTGAYKKGMQSTYVPYRNGIFLSVAASIALQLGCDAVAYGAHLDDAAGDAYPDCSLDFAAAQARAIKLGTGKKIEMLRPFIKQTKADIVRTGLLLNVPFELTWSCYAGGDEPCGVCGTCIDRAKAFALNHAEDPALKIGGENK